MDIEELKRVIYQAGRQLDTVEDLLDGWIEETHDPYGTRLRILIELIRETVSRVTEIQDSPDFVKGQQFEMFVKNVGTIATQTSRLRDIVQRRLSDLEGVFTKDDEHLLQEAGETIEIVFGRALTELDRVYRESNLPKENIEAALESITRIRTRLHLRQIQDAAEEAEAARGLTIEARDAAQQAAGRTGDVALGAHFGQLASRETRTANVLRLCAIGILLALVAAATIIISRNPSIGSVSEEILRVSVSLPLAVLAAYLGRESSRHRSAADWARQLEVQLETLDAFIAPLAEERRQYLREEFGKLVFSRNSTTGQSLDSPSGLNESADMVSRATRGLRRSN